MAGEIAKWLSDLIMDEDPGDWDSEKTYPVKNKGKKGGKAARKRTKKQS